MITGTSSGIGKETAKLLLSKKYKVIGISRSNSKIFSKNYYHLPIDISKRENDLKIVNFLKSKKINLDGIVNNAGVNIPNKFDKISKKDFDYILKSNLEAPFFIVQKLIKFLNKNSSIVNISSFSSISGLIQAIIISKSGIETLTKNLAIFFKEKKNRVNAISPGLIKIILAKGFKNHPYFNRILLNRIGLTKEVSDVIYFLLSKNSSYINGQIINVDGGMFLK